MEKHIDKLEELARKWLDGTASDAEEQQLREACRTTGPLPEQLRSTALIMKGMQALASETAPGPVIHRPHAKPYRILHRITIWSVAAAAVVAAVLLLRPEPYCYINGKAVRDLDVAMNETACFGHLEELDRSFESLKQLESLLAPDDDPQNNKQ